MQYKLFSRLVASLAFFWGAPTNASRNASAADNDLNQVAQIFAAIEGPSDKKSTPNVAYVRLQKVNPNETGSDSTHYAYLLGLVVLHREREAVAYAGEWLQRNPYDIRCRLLRTRLLLREKKFSEVFVDLETASRSLAEQTRKETLDVETEASWRAAGLMFGYLEGPAKSLVKATLGKGIKDRLLTDASPAAKRAFTEQYDAVQEEYKALVEKGEDAFRELQEKHREDREAVTERRAKLEEQKTEAEHQKQTLVDQLNKKWDTAKSDYDRLAARYSNLETVQAQLINTRSLLAGQAVTSLPREPIRDRNGTINREEQDQYDREKRRYDQLVTQVNLADRQILQGAITLKQAWNQGVNATANLHRLQVEGHRLGVEFALKDRAFAKQEAQLNHNDPTKKKLPNAPTKQLEQSFTQYDDFNYLQEKQRLLDSLRLASSLKTGP